MADKVNTLQSLKTRQADSWYTALQQLTQEHPITSIENVVAVDTAIRKYPHCKHCRLEYSVSAQSPQRNLELFDHHKKLIHVCYDLQLVDGRLFVREAYRSRLSWFNYFFSRLHTPRGPTVNVNVRR